jgi:hypothetical protein
MPLRDHFHPPVKELLEWDTLHSGWATNVTEALNTQWLPPEFVAKEHTRSGGRLEIDVATYEQAHGPALGVSGGPNGGGTTTATMPRVYAPPQAILTMPGVFPDDFEVRVFSTRGGNRLVAAIELISPGNKDRSDERRAFAAKCAAYLQQGVSLVIVDVVTERRANLHNEIIRVMDGREEYLMPATTNLYAIAYRPVLRNGNVEIDLWPMPLSIGETLPTMPLRLLDDLFVPVELEITYTETCRKRRLI